MKLDTSINHIIYYQNLPLNDIKVQDFIELYCHIGEHV